ncbi:hypothetical protein STAS_19786 [Striga asiatica]|uniref:Uncharacterized protein n=1 Tax=Striga asiatica TaxID=4170 RepID=A0A5A7QGF4_STRAF|nr:hypothetical protein STAS_19786 [Striga asiatica]
MWGIETKRNFTSLSVQALSSGARFEYRASEKALANLSISMSSSSSLRLECLECKYTDSQYIVSSLAFHKRGKILELPGDEGYTSLWPLDHFPPKLMSEICIDKISIQKFYFNESGDPTIIDLNLGFDDEDEDLEMLIRGTHMCKLLRNLNIILLNFELAVHDNIVVVPTKDSYARINDTRMSISPFTKLRPDVSPDVIGDSDTVETLRFSVHGDKTKPRAPHGPKTSICGSLVST